MRLVSSLALLVSAASCLPSASGTNPGMAQRPRRPYAADATLDELARLEVANGQRPLLVVYPRSACSGSAKAVFVDRSGRFLGAVGPGQAALFGVPSGGGLLAFSSVELTSPLGRWFAIDEIEPPAPGSGLLLEAPRVSARQCGSGQYANPNVATKRELEAALAESDVEWLEPRLAEGQAWLDEHHERVDELVGRQEAKPQPIVRRVIVP